MSGQSVPPRHRAAAGLLRLARAGHAQWLFGNLYEAVVKVPDLLAERAGEPAEGAGCGGGGALTPLGPGSPVRYYAAAMPATTPAVLVAAAMGWDKPESRPWLAAAAVCSLSGSAASVYLVRAINLRLFFGDRALSTAERERLLRTWYRVNAFRMAAAGAALAAAGRGGTRLLRR
ncbi:hypothetical protein GCM10023224_14530 [Streptomonospora halophila]|uniref:Uncharacterized protein n=1 Tax=Streptomonospora halophila TaxID=427369 RepID=A0ABP9GAZ2_9ACTN